MYTDLIVIRGQLEGHHDWSLVTVDSPYRTGTAYPALLRPLVYGPSYAGPYSA